MTMYSELIKDLEQRGEEAVKTGFLNGEYKPPAYNLVKEWLSSKSAERAESNTREAIRIARSANRTAWIAIAATVITATIAVAATILR